MRLFLMGVCVGIASVCTWNIFHDGLNADRWCFAAIASLVVGGVILGSRGPHKPKCEHVWWSADCRYWEPDDGAISWTNVSSMCVRCGCTRFTRRHGRWAPDVLNNGYKTPSELLASLRQQ